jgi:cytochrome c553
MRKSIWIRSAFLVLCGGLIGAALDRSWTLGVIPTVSAQQQGRRNALPTMESLPMEVAQLKALVPSNSHIMMDVQFHWTNLWFAGRKKNWPLAQYFFNESRGHIQWLIRKSPIIRGPDGKDVDISGIFDGVDTSSLAAVKTAIEKQDSVQFAASYKTMLESCYACHKSVGRPYIRPMIPQTQVQAILNLDPNATWPQ